MRRHLTTSMAWRLESISLAAISSLRPRDEDDRGYAASRIRLASGSRLSFELLAEPQIAAACLRNSARGFQKRGYSLRSCVHQVGAGPDEG
jgi:hypothetical protein